MRIRPAALLAAGVLAAGLTSAVPPAATATGPTPPEPPAVGSCHDLDIDEARALTDPDPVVPCTEPHTTMTIGVVRFDDPPSWSDVESYDVKVRARCLRKLAAFFDDRFKALQLSAYWSYYFIPTRAERDAGAAWARCDVALLAPNAVPALPTDDTPLLGPLPLDDWVLRCAVRRDGSYWSTTCDRNHAYRATHAIEYPKATYPGVEAGRTWAIRKCRAKLGDRPFVYSFYPKPFFDVGFRYAVCLKKTST